MKSTALLMLSILTMILGVSAVLVVQVYAEPVRDIPTAEEQQWLFMELEGWTGDMSVVISDVMAAGDYSSLSFSAPISMHMVSQAFVDGTVTENLGSEVLPYHEELFLPVQQFSETVGVLGILAFPQTGWTMDYPYGLDCASALESLGSGVKVIRAFGGARRVLLAVDGESVEGIEECSDEPIPDVETLAEYQQYLDDMKMVSGIAGGGGLGTERQSDLGTTLLARAEGHSESAAGLDASPPVAGASGADGRNIALLVVVASVGLVGVALLWRRML